MSLPLALKTSLPTIPSSARYLSADPDAVRRWRGRLGNDSRPRIGLAWSGNALQKGDAQRSIPLQYLLARLPAGFQYVSLHKEVRAADAETLRVNRQIRDFADEQGDFGDAAALCECMDLVISVDTSLAHLSAAVGTRTWIMLPFHPDWRWLLDRDDSPWYPSVRLYRQVRYGDWQGVCARIAADLTSAPINSWRSMSATGGIAAAASALQG